MKKTFALRHLTFAVIGTMTSAVAVADTTEPSVDLGHEVINIDRQGTKVKTNVVTLQEKDESTATELRDLLKSEPSVDFGSGRGASQYITIRGMGQNSIDVKIDNAYSDSQILYHQGRHQLDPSLVKVVSVQKGAGSASSGIGGTNGAIVAKTVDAHDLLRDGQDIGFKVGAGYSSNDENSYNAAVYGKAGAFDFLLAGNKVNQSNYKPGKGYANYLGGDTVPSTDLDKVSYLAKLGATFGDHRFVLSHMNQTDKGVRNVREEFDITTNPRLSLTRQDPQYRELSLVQTGLEWTGQNLGFADEVTANVYVMENERESAGGEQYGNPGIRKVATEPFILGHNTTKVKTKGANINFDTYVNDDVLLKYGLNYRHQESIPNYLRKATDLVNVGTNNRPNWRPYGQDLNHQEKTDVGVYVETIANIGDVTATAGLRYDRFNFKAMDGRETSGDTLSPSVGLIWQPVPSLSLSATHNHATRSPRMYDALRSGQVITIDDNVKAEKAKNTEVGFNYKYGKFTFDGSYYWQEIDDLLNSSQVAVHDQLTGNIISTRGIDNVGYAKNKGWELGTTFKHNGFSARLGVAESNPEFYSSPDEFGNSVSFANREYAVALGRTWTAGLAYRFANPNLEVGINHRLTEDVVGAPYQTSTPNNEVREGYDTTDIYANWKPYGNDRMNVNFAVNNVTDELYRPHTMSLGAMPAVGREFRVGVNFTY